MNTTTLSLDRFYYYKQDKSLEALYTQLKIALMNESSRHYVIKNKLERVEIAKLDIEYALAYERQTHEQTKKIMGEEITRLKCKLENMKVQL